MEQNAAAASLTEPLPADLPPTEVHVRMYRALQAVDADKREYRGLLGDCFLIRATRGVYSSNILIDCGMLLGSPDAKERMQAIAADIAKACGEDPRSGKVGSLDLLVITHEHWDHISGFSQASDILLNPQRLAIRNIWMAWTEDPKNEQAIRLRKRFEASGVAFASLAERLRQRSDFGDDAAYRALFGLDGFMGLAARHPAEGESPARLAGREIIERLRRPETQYLEPGTVLDTPGDVRLTTYVLGPPRDEKLLFKDRPSASNQETYLDAPGIDAKQLLRFADGHDPEPASDSPFAPTFCRFKSAEVASSLASGAPPDGETCEFLRSRYYGVPEMTGQERQAVERRRIDGDWLGVIGALALKLDSDTNNTSLVLAFELPDEDRSVLLFAADAQVGNWLSWHENRYVRDKLDTGVTAKDLLARTKLYKVGHHGSHNATLDCLGLAQMTRDDLVALIPTDEALGKKQGSKGWKMPDPRLYAALKERTAGRIVRSDRCYSSNDRATDPELKNVDPAFFDHLKEEPLFLEYRVL